jgi:hypothetical protein
MQHTTHYSELPAPTWPAMTVQIGRWRISQDLRERTPPANHYARSSTIYYDQVAPHDWVCGSVCMGGRGFRWEATCKAEGEAGEVTLLSAWFETRHEALAAVDAVLDKGYEHVGRVRPRMRRRAAKVATVKRCDLFGNVIDTYQTEAELNGWRPVNGRLF